MNYTCHTCQQTLVPQDDPNKIMCPDLHVSLNLSNNKIIGYHVFWDIDEDATQRYELFSYQGTTHLYSTHSEAGQYWRGLSKIIFTCPTFIPLPIKDGAIQINNLILRLKKLNIFS